MAEVTAIGAVSPLGVGDEAWSNGPIGAPAPCRIARDEAFERAGLRRPFAARAMHASTDLDRATALLLAAFAQIEREIPVESRIGVAIGSSSGGMESSEKFFAARARGGTIHRALADAATYHAPFRALVDRLRARGQTITRTAHVLTACSASTIALGLGDAWLRANECDVVIAGGYDALTTFVASGFEALGATTAHPPPRPFRVGRDGMSLGEGAALFVLRASGARAPIAKIAGFSASGDAVHLTAPDREGRGAGRTARAAMQRAAVEASQIDLVSVHGTSTPFNDAMEHRALVHAFGDRARVVPVHAPKATIGHTLGAAGALETAMLVDAIRRGVLPATPGEGEIDADAPAALRTHVEAADVRRTLKLSSAFGGANAGLVVVSPGISSAPAIARSPCASVARVEVDAAIDLARIAERSGIARERLGRMDAVCHLALAAVAELAHDVGREALRGAGIVLGTAFATIDVNALYAEGIRKRGAAHGEGRRFAYTTPNAAAGECAIAFGLTGPNVAVGRGVDAHEEAHEVARDLVEDGVCDRIVVVEVDADGPCTRFQAEILGWNVRFGARATLIKRAS